MTRKSKQVEQTAVRGYANHVVLYSHDGDDDPAIYVFAREDILYAAIGRNDGEPTLFLQTRDRSDKDLVEIPLPEEHALKVVSWWVGGPVPPREIAVIEDPVAYESALAAYEKNR